MTDYAEERRSELEVLESIFPDELTVISDDKLCIRVEPETPHPNDPHVLSLIIQYSPTYPDELPEISIECLEGTMSEEEEEGLVMGLIGVANDSIGMAMVYTLSLYLSESLAAMIEERNTRIQKAADEKTRIEEEAAAIQTAGTKVTLESFETWKVGFEAELVLKRKQEEQDRLRALPPKEREETKRYLAKLSGRQLFEKDSALITSDSAFDEEGAEAVDVSLYERVEGLSEDEEEETKLGDLSDSD